MASSEERDCIAVGRCPKCDSFLEFMRDDSVRCGKCGFEGVAE